jgi:hypothetical protein
MPNAPMAAAIQGLTDQAHAWIDTRTCPQCGNPFATATGAFSDITWFECDACGAIWHETRAGTVEAFQLECRPDASRRL